MKKASDLLKIRDSIIYNSNVKSDIKLIGLGDLHLSNLVGQKDVDLVLKSIDEEKPNYICFLGDLIDSPLLLTNDKKLKELESLIKNSAEIAPTFIVLGSHDFIDESTDNFSDILSLMDIWDYLDSISNVNVLNDKFYSNEEIFIAGYRQKRDVYYNLMNEHVEDANAYYNDVIKYTSLYTCLPMEKPKIFLTHSPEPLHNKNNINLLSGYDVIMAGHYHNGCVPALLDNIMPGNMGLITSRKKLFPSKARGIDRLQSGTYLIYSGGWVKIQECAPTLLHPLDDLCNRQMDVVTLTSDEEIKEIKTSDKRKVLKIR